MSLGVTKKKMSFVSKEIPQLYSFMLFSDGVGVYVADILVSPYVVTRPHDKPKPDRRHIGEEEKGMMTVQYISSWWLGH